MSGLIEYYARRRRAQADKKAEQAHDEAWVPQAAETEAVAPPRQPSRSSTAWTNGHVRNVRPVSRRDGRRKATADGTEDYFVSRNGRDSGHDARSAPPDDATGSEDRFVDDLPLTEEHAMPDDDLIADEPFMNGGPAAQADAVLADEPPEAAPQGEETPPEGAVYDESPTAELRALTIEQIQAVTEQAEPDEPVAEPQAEPEAREDDEPAPEPVRAQSIQWPPRKPAGEQAPPAESTAPVAEANAEPTQPAAAAPPAEPTQPAAAAPPAEPTQPAAAPRARRPDRPRASARRSTAEPAPPPAGRSSGPEPGAATRALRRVMSWRASGSGAAEEGAPGPVPSGSPSTERPAPGESPPEPRRRAAPRRARQPTPREKSTPREKPTPRDRAEVVLPPGDAPLGFRERGQLRQRARYLRHLREVQLRDLGGFVLELHRFDKWRGDLVGMKLAEVAETDRELRALESVLAEERPLREVREAGIGGVCGRCGKVHGSVDRFCAACGSPLSGGATDGRRGAVRERGAR